MMDAISTLSSYFQYPFVRYAMVVGVLVALCSSLLGVPLVLKRFSFIGDGLSHVAFGALAIAAVLHMQNEMLLVLPVTAATAVILLRTGRHTQIKGDAMLAMLSVGALAMGYLLMNLFSVSANVSGDVCTTLFGSTSILTLSAFDMWLSVGMSAVVIGVLLLLYHKLFSVTFDETFAVATGIRAGLYNLLLAVLCAVVIVLAMNLVGALLVSALVIFPALSAMRVFQTFRAVVCCSAVLSVCGAAAGILVSILLSAPVGATIVAIDIGLFLLCAAVGRLKRGAVR